MKRLGPLLARLLARAAFVLAVLLTAAAVALTIVERTGWLRERVRAEVADRLGTLGDDLWIESVELRWFEPALHVEGVRLGREVQHLAIEELHVRLRPTLDPSALVEWVRVLGGRLRLSAELRREIEASGAGGDDPFRREGVLLPFVSVESFDLALAVPGCGDVPIGRANVQLAPRADGLYSLAGDLTPAVFQGAVEPVPVHLGGREVQPNRFEVYTAVSELDVALDTLACARWLESDSIAARTLRQLHGRLSLELAAEFSPVGAIQPRADLRVSCSAHELRLPAADPAVEDSGVTLENVDVEVDLRFSPTAEQSIRSPAAWTGTGLASAFREEARLEAWALLGRAAGDGELARVWARLDRQELERELATLLPRDARRRYLEVHHALGARGGFDLAVAGSFPRSSPDRSFEIVCSARPSESIEMRWVGLPNDVGEIQGFPLPMRDVTGRAVLAWTPEHETPGLAALCELEGDHGSGRGRGWGTFAFGPPGGPAEGHDVEIHFTSDSLAIDERLEEALAGAEGTSRIWHRYAPRGGRIGGSARIFRRATMDGVAGEIDLELRDAELAWHHLPLPVSDADGTLRMRWGEHEVPRLGDPDRPPMRRPIGVAWDLRGRLRSAESVHVRGAVRDEPIVVHHERIASQLVVDVDVEARGLDVEGPDVERCRRAFPEVGDRLHEAGLEGTVDVRTRWTSPLPGAVPELSIEVRPVRASATPPDFPLRVGELEGRVLVGGKIEDDEAGGARLGSSAVLAGSWPGGAPVRAELRARGRDAALSIAIPGVDPADPELRDTIDAMLGRDEAAERADAIELDGRVDVEAEVALQVSPEGVRPESEMRAHLRDVVIAHDRLRLEAVRGSLALEDRELRSPRVDARFGSTPVRLRDLTLRSLAAAELDPREEEREALGGSLPEGEGFVMHARIDATNVPLDAEHLDLLLEEEMRVALLEGFGWTGNLDVEGASLVVAGASDAPARIGLRGLVVPHNLTGRLGLPVRVLSGEVDVRSLVVEEGRLRGWARIGEVFARVAGRELNRASMVLTLVDQRATIDDLAGELAGGTVSSLGGDEPGDAAFALDLREPHRFELAVELTEVDVAPLLKGLFDAGATDSGVLNGRVRIAGSPDRLLDVRGVGAIEVRDARLWSIPVIRVFFTTLGFGASAVFDRMRMSFEVRDGRISMTAMRAHSHFLDLLGSGVLDFNGDLRHDFDVRYGLIDRLGPLTQILYWIQNSLLRVSVRGTMLRPEVILRNSIVDAIFFEEREGPPLPLPPFSGIPERF